jgi:O-antigen/teichoic acid export membrane protein
MSIRRQSILSSLVIYFGFGIGLLNIWLFTKQGLFLDKEFGLYNAFIAIASMMMAISNMAMPSYLIKFYPYYHDHLPQKKNDQFSVALITAVLGFVVVIAAGVFFKDLVIKKYGTNAPEVVHYYDWIFPLGFGLLLYTLLESFAWQLHRSVLTNFLREVMWRLFTTVLIVLFATGVIENFDLFIKLFSFSYPFIALLLAGWLIVKKKIHLQFRISHVTRRLSKQILKFSSFVYAGGLIFTLSLVFDSLVITSVLDNALAQLAVYSVAQNVASMIQVPQRGIIAASLAHLSRAWKDKNRETIQRIYQRSSINQLLFACGLLALIVLCFTEAVVFFNLKGTYLDAYWVVILLGLSKVVDMGTGVNAQIIATSTYWRFEMVSGMILLAVMLPLSYLLTKEYGISGAAFAHLVSIIVYNAIRIIFLWKKFRLFPFTMKTLYAFAWAAFCFAACFFAFASLEGIFAIVVRANVFMIAYVAGILYMKISPDILPVLASIRKRMRF